MGCILWSRKSRLYQWKNKNLMNGRKKKKVKRCVSSTCGFTSKMQIFPVSITSWMELIFVPYRFPSYSPCSKKRPFLMSHSISLRVMKEYIWPSLSSTFGFLEVTEDKSVKCRNITEQHPCKAVFYISCTCEVWHKALKQSSDQSSTSSCQKHDWIRRISKQILVWILSLVGKKLYNWFTICIVIISALTGDGGAIALGIRHHQFVFKTATANPLCTDQDQRLPPEGWNLCNLFIYLQLMAIKFCIPLERVR